tara:strand:+ start:52093 stop:52497 length:405 start_codon:yes stop_codon:yes gene_type:complete
MTVLPPPARPWGWFALFASTTTLLCCALPILLVFLGLGAVSATLFASLPFLVTLSHYKLYLFIGSGVLLAAASWARFRPGRQCPADPELAARCAAADRWNLRVLIVSAAIWTIGFTAAYLSLPMFDLYKSLVGQ